ncbi:hypothetical protein DPEC_G00027030 [Dallia pectoralis]|uniref:Uncharacterized protein n=1 Tax=Dallia pectoralis TaxID=75939 RepID=A0ACC2HIG7_DALPE|nr:hypothetical protein DPEC_G00027030 [Dallia pectoralis]
MRRFFGPHNLRDEAGSQIQYLTSKCNRLTHDKGWAMIDLFIGLLPAFATAVLERECLVAGERERCLKKELEALATRLCQQEQVKIELMIKHDQLLGRLTREQGIVAFLRQQVQEVAGESSRDAAQLGQQLEQVNLELLHLQRTEEKLHGLVEKMHAETLKRTALTEALQTQLQSKVCELDELRSGHQKKIQELQSESDRLCDANQRKVQELRSENECSLRKLQDTAEQFEWLCEHQRYWMCCVKRFKDCLSEEKRALVQQVTRLKKEVAELRGNPQGSGNTGQIQDIPPADTDSQHCTRVSSWESDEMANLQTQVDRWRGLFLHHFSQSPPYQECPVVDGCQKPP